MKTEVRHMNKLLVQNQARSKRMSQGQPENIANPLHNFQFKVEQGLL